MAIKESLLTTTNGTTPQVVQGTIHYYLDPSKGGWKDFYPGTAGGYRRKFDEVLMPMTDIRGLEEELDIEKQGFTYVQHSITEKEFANEDGIKERLYPEISELVKKVTGASQVRPFSHLVRHQKWEDAQPDWADKADDEIVRKRVPARFAHVDHSYYGAQQILRDNLTDEEEREKLTKTRWGIINVWRPIHHPVTRDPLAVCDARSVAESDLVGSTAFLPPPESGTFENVSLGREFETWAVRANPASHKWYFKSEMTPDEALLLKIFDSKKDGRSRRVPHTSFQSELDHGDARHSVEIRCFVFWEDETLE